MYKVLVLFIATRFLVTSWPCWLLGPKTSIGLCFYFRLRELHRWNVHTVAIPVEQDLLPFAYRVGAGFDPLAGTGIGV